MPGKVARGPDSLVRMDRSAGRHAGHHGAPVPGGDAAARRAVAAALAGLHPIVTQSRDGLTLVVLGRGGDAADARTDGLPQAADFPLPPGAVGVAVGLYDRLVGVETFADPDALAAAWPGIVADSAEAWARERDAIRARRTPAPGRGRPDDGAPGRLLRRASVAVGDAAPVDAAPVAPARAPAPGPVADRAAAAPAPADVIVPIRGERVEGSARVVDGRVVRLSIHRREPPDPPDGLVP